MYYTGSFNKPDRLPVLPLKNAVLFPGSIAPMAVGRPFSLRALDEISNREPMLAVFTQIDPELENPGIIDLHQIGCAAKVLKVVDERRGGKTVLLQGLSRLRIANELHSRPYIEIEPEYIEDKFEKDSEIEALLSKLKELAHEVIRLNPAFPNEFQRFVDEMDHPGTLADLIAANLIAELNDKMSILDTLDIKARLRMVINMLSNEIKVAELKKRIDSEVKGEMDKQQKEYYLRRQMDAIRRELGDSCNPEEETDELKKAVLDADLPEEAKKAAEKELQRLSRISGSSPEYAVSRNYLDWILELPWKKFTQDHLDINEAEKILNADHYGLEKVKKRILEYLAVRKLKSDTKGPILCLIGPPGVGKTSLGKSVAHAMGREFYRISLGGIHDEAEIRGHRRTYVGALPGRILQGMKKVGVNNPVFMLDELDKIGADYRGDPSSALLEVLDPEQNDSFTDNYLGIPFDLSKVFFIGTANVSDTIPPPLRDRMEIIEIPGYTQEEKVLIAKGYLIDEELANHGLNLEMLSITDDALNFIIDNYTREAGVRNLKRNIAAICRGAAKMIASGEATSIVTDIEKVHMFLGAERFFPEVAERTSVPGVATGMAWTPTGGDIIFIEATMMKGKGNIQLTGKLGDVMKESAYAALSYIRAKAKDFQIDEDVFEKFDIHIHIPAGAIPKDGPSAGITLLAALASLLTGKKVSSQIAMTGEVTLRGHILPVGGIKEKVLAAKRAGIREVLLPEKNRKDLEEIPEEVRKGLELHFITNIEEALKIAFKNGDEIKKIIS